MRPLSTLGSESVGCLVQDQPSVFGAPYPTFPDEAIPTASWSSTGLAHLRPWELASEMPNSVSNLVFEREVHVGLPSVSTGILKRENAREIRPIPSESD